MADSDLKFDEQYINNALGEMGLDRDTFWRTLPGAGPSGTGADVGPIAEQETVKRAYDRINHWLDQQGRDKDTFWNRVPSPPNPTESAPPAPSPTPSATGSPAPRGTFIEPGGRDPYQDWLDRHPEQPATHQDGHSSLDAGHTGDGSLPADDPGTGDFGSGSTLAGVPADHAAPGDNGPAGFAEDPGFGSGETLASAPTGGGEGDDTGWLNADDGNDTELVDAGGDDGGTFVDSGPAPTDPLPADDPGTIAEASPPPVDDGTAPPGGDMSACV